MSARKHEAAAEVAQQLYGAESLRGFTEERKRLADALRRAGDPAAAQVAKLPKPSVSAWAVNRLWHLARKDFQELFAVGERLRAGDFAAGAAQREVLARLRKRAEAVLQGDGHGASPAVLSRIATTLQALSAIGSFDPDPPGALAADRDPPGFEVLTGKVTSSLPAPRRREAEKKAASAGAARAARQHAAALERAQRTAERLRHAATAQAAVVDELRAKLRAAEADLKEASNRATAAEKELAKLEPPE